MYPNEDSISKPMLPLLHSPINYENANHQEDEYRQSAEVAETYNNSYMFKEKVITQEETSQLVEKSTAPQNANEGTTMAHLGPPWFHWQEGSGHLGYKVLHQGKVIQCPYI
jgi:hypothetical protein